MCAGVDRWVVVCGMDGVVCVGPRLNQFCMVFSSPPFPSVHFLRYKGCVKRIKGWLRSVLNGLMEPWAQYSH